MSQKFTHSHTRLVELVTKVMVDQHFTYVKTSRLPCFAPCDLIGSASPDVTGYADGTFIIAEAIPNVSLATASTWKQWQLFHTEANRRGGHFIVVVDKADEAAARLLLEHVCGDAANVCVWSF